MKRIYAAIMLLLLIITVGLAERYFSLKASNDTLEAIENAENSGYTLTSCENIRSVWSGSKPALELFMPHPDLDSADLTADKLVLYAEMNDKENLAIYISEMKDRMKALGEAEKINIYNLM